MSTCEFHYIRRGDYLPIQAKGIEKSWFELRREFGANGPGYPNAVYYKTISPEGPRFFAVVNRKWVLYNERNQWHRYVSACDLKFNDLNGDKSNSIPKNGGHEDGSWIVISKEDYDLEQAS